MPDKKYLIEIPDMPDSSGVWDADKWERNKDKFMQKYPTANVFELGAYDPNDMDENDQFMLTFDNDEESSGVWDAAKWERNKDKFLAKYPDAHVNRVRYMDYWGDKAKSDQARIAELQQPDEERNARLAEIGYYDDSTGTQVDYANSVGLSPLSSAIEQNSVSGEVTYLDPRVEEFFANDTEYTDRQMELNRLRDEYEANPRVIEQREYEAQMARYAEELEKQIKADMEADVDAYHAGQGAAAKHMQDASGANQTIQAIRMLKGEDVGKDVIENEKQERYASALKLLQQAKDARNVAGKGMAGGVVDTAKDWARNLGTQSDIEMYNEVGNILTALEQKVGNLNEVSDEVIEENLTNDEKALIRAFFEYNAAMADAGEDMSIWYKGGKIFAESIPFMMEFLVTGGLANTAGRAATSWMGKGFGKWIAKSAKGTAARAAKKVAAKTVSGVAKTVVAAGARTLAAPTTYKNIAEQSVQYGADGHLDREGNMVKAAVDSYIEQLSEMSGAAFGKVLGGVGRLALGKTAFEKVGAWFGNNAVMQNLSKLGFHGLPEEVGEEIFGNALRTITGVDEEALSRMFEKDEFASMIIGFAPMTLFGAGMSMAKMGAVSIGAANAGRRMRQDLSRSYTEEQIDQVEMALDEAKDANEIANAIRPIIMGMQAAGAPLYEVQSVWDYAIAVAKKKAMVSAQSAQELQLAQAKIGEAQERMGGRFWIEDKDGVKSVKQVVLNNGNTAYVVSEPDQDGRVAIINATTGQKGTALPEDIKEESWNGTLNAFGTGLVMADRTQREQQRMQEDRAAQINEVRNRLSADPRINVGTEGSPIYLVAQSFNDAGVRYVAQDGSAGNISWEQAADSIGMPIIVKTDAQIAQEEAETLVAAAAERRAKRAKKDAVGTTERDNAIVDAENAVAGANEAARHIPMNEDGTVNEAAFWEQSPEEYVKWNDEQNQDGGQDSLQQVAIAKQELMGLLQEANAAQNTSNPTTRKAAKKEVERLADRIARLDAIEQSYMQSLEEEKAAVQQTAATPTSSMSEEDLESMDAQYQGILGKTRVQGERVRVMQEYLDKLAEGSVPVVLLTRQNYEEKMKADGLHNAIIRRVKAQVDAGRSVAGFMANGKVYLMDEGLNSIDAARITYIHERQHTFNRTNNDMLAEVANLLESKEKAIEILKTFVGEKGIGVYESLSIEGLADEIVAYSMEKAYTTEDFSVDLQSRGIPSEVISIITEIDNEQRKDQSLSQARRRRGVHSHAAVSGAGSVREDGRNLEQISGGVLEQQAARPSGSSGRGAQIGEGGEPAEVISDDEGPSFRITKPEDPNGVTPEQIDEINRSVGGELEIGDEDAPVRFSVTAIGEGAGLTILKDDGEGNVAFVLPDGRRFNANNLLKPEDIKSLPNTVLGYMMKDAKSLGNVDSRKEWMLWNKYTLMLNAILLKGSAENGGFDTLSSQWQWIGDTIYKTVAINSDSQYSFSLDITRVCKKNEAVINAIAEMQARLGYGITPGQIMDIYLTTSEEGYQVPCPVCYVFSRYIRNGKYATIMINGQRKYGNELVDPRSLTPEQRKERIKFWKDELKKIKDENKAHSKEIAKANSDITTLLDEIDKIAKELTNPENNFSEEEKAQMMGKIYELDARYKAALNVVSQASLDSWITQFAIHKVKVDGKEQWVLYEDSYMGFPEEMALDLRQTSTVMRKYPAIQRFRNSRGAAAGKEITFVANNDLGDVPLALGSSAATKDLAKPREMSDEEWNELQEKEYAELKLGVKNLYQRAVEEKDPKKKKKLLESAKKRFTAASIYAKQQSLRGGQRMWSWSDNIERLAPDVFVNLLQLEMLGGALQSYSKQLEGIKLVASMNGYVNGSLMGKGNGYREVTAEQTEEVDGQLYLKDGDFMVAEPGKKPFVLKTPVYQHTDGKLYVLEFDDVVGIDPFGKKVDGKHMKGLFELNAEYDRAGNIIVGMNDLHIRMCMADDRIFFIIPWHSSGANSHILAQMYEYLGVEYDVKLSQDYTDVQSEKRYKAPTEAEEETDSEAEEEVAEEGEEKKTESNKISQFLVDFWNDHYENAREYAGYDAVAGKDFACGIEGGVEPSDGNGNLSASQIHYRELRDAIFVGVKVPNGVDKNGKAKTKTLSVEEYSEEWFNEIMNDAFLSQVYTKVRALMGDKGMTSADTKAIYPYEYWDESSTYDTADINGARYLEYCRRLGYKPKFCGKLDGKPESDHGNFTDDKGYWKVLIDRRMYAISGRFQDLTPVTADNFTPDLVDPEVTKEEFIVTRVADEAGTQTIVDKAIAREESRPGGIAKVNYDMTLNDALEVYNNGDVRMRVSSPSGVIDLVEEAKKAQAKHDAKESDVRFRMSNENQAIFVSNAARAVEGIKQEKATPEQWLKMIEKAGGLKAGEDKWIGLSDWLKASDKKTLTKQEVLEFIGEHMIVINEVHYGARAEEAAAEQHALLEQRVNERYEEILDSIQDIEDYDEKRTKAFEQLKDELDEWGDYVDLDMYNVYLTFPYEDLGDYIEMADIFGVEISLGNPINDVRLNYTTDGLDNKREIALTVPTIESWNKSDDIHFGDAGDGRAVAWIRFGETEVPTGEYKVLLDEMNRLKEVARELYEEFGGRSNELAEVEERQDELRAEMRSYKNPGLKVLVIDEIQSKRHQEGREKGYRSKDYWKRRTDYLAARTMHDGLYDEMKEKYGDDWINADTEGDVKRLVTEEEFARLVKANEEFDAAAGAYKGMVNAIPDAPFDKNWHELAMKRMLRYAAENGYDVIAWTKGDQQAERYNIGSYVSSIEAQEEYDGNRDFGFYMGESDEALIVTVDENGTVVSAEDHLSQAVGRPLADLVGKEMAVKMMQMEEYDVLEDTDLKVGNEGMKGFYDKMLPAFMNKYGKRWGVKVEDIELPNLEDGLTMHSIPVTEEMKASVMEGQVMFRMRGENETAEEFVNGIIDDFKAKYNAFNEIIALDPTSKTQVAKFIGVSEEDISDEDMASFLKELEERDSRGWYNNKRIAIFVRKNVTDGKKSELVLIHENIHAINKEHPDLIAIGEYLWNTAQKGTREYKYKMAIAKAYPESEWFDEMSAYVVSEYMQDEQIDKLKSLLDSDNIESLNKLLNISGYGKDRSKQRPRVTWNVLRKRPSETTEESGRTEEGGEPGDLRFRTTEITPEVREEMDAIHASAILMGNFMKAPNGQPTNLTEEQWLMVRTENFINWFGDWINDPANASKIVDENGEPMVMIHGSQNKFSVFRRGRGPHGMSGRGMYFGRAPKDIDSFSYGGASGQKYLVFLNVRNLYDATKYRIDRKLRSNDVGKLIPKDVMDEIIGTSSYEEFVESVTDINKARFASSQSIVKDISKKTYQRIHDSFDGKGMFTSKENVVKRIFRKNRTYLTLNHDFIGEIVVRDPNQIKSATDNNGEFNPENEDIRFSIRTKPAPKKTGKGYKVFYLKDGKLYPPMVANLGGVDTPVGVWLDAEEGTRAGVSKTGRPKVKQGGKGTQGGSGTLAYRPGWHLGEIPYAIQFNRKDENGDRTLFPADFVWAEVEYANDVDYQEEAMSYGMNANGKFQHSLAGLPKLPTDGSYRYRTNPNPETDPWIITGAMKVNRLLTPSEVDQMVVDAGREPQKRQEGAVTDEQIEALNKELGLVEEEEEVSFRTTGTPTEDVVAEGVSLSPAQLASLAGDIFSALPEDSRKKITDGLNGNILGLQDAILQIPTSLATKEEWSDEDRQMAEVVAEQMTKAVGIEMTRPFSASEALWTLYNAVNKSTDLVSEASRALVRRNLGMGQSQSTLDSVQFRTSDSFESIDEIVNNGKQKVSDENSASAIELMTKLNSINATLAQIRSITAAQKEYDKATVKIVSDLANELLEKGALSDMTRNEIKRLLSAIKDAVGKKDLSVSVERLMDIMIANQLRHGRDRFKQILKIRDKRVDQRGIEVRGKLDVNGQRVMDALREGIGLDLERLEDRINETLNKMFDASDVVKKNAENELAGYELAKLYLQNIKESEQEEKDLRKELKDAKEVYDGGGMSKDAYREFVQSIYAAIRENRMQRVNDYANLFAEVTKMVTESTAKASLLRDAEKARVERIHHYANSDMQGMPSVQQGEVKSSFWNNTILRFLFKPLATFDQMLRSFAPKSRNGEGYLWNHFMGGWLRSSENEFKGIQAAHEQLDAKVRSMFAGVKRWSDLFSIEKKLPTMEVKFWDGEKMADFTLTQGNLLYIYMVNKMTDGEMKLRKMGITEEDVSNIARELDPRFIELADWIQDTFLPGLREKYNTLHEKMFGAPMAAIDNYFPIRVLANARTREVDLAVEESSAKPSTITGSIIKRTKNSLALDILGSDAFDVVLEHIEQMEHWAAFAEFNRDLNTLLSYRKFRNRVQNMRGIYGAGTTVWNNFRSVAEIAAGVYKPAVKGDSLDKLITNIAKGVTGAKISFRVYTALKQFLSAPAFVSDASAAALIKSLANPYKAWTWAMKELPLFEKRWKSRQAGDSRLMETESDWKLWKNKIVELAGRYGMTPNAFVDALTVSIGARAIYETKRKEYVKLGYTQDQAEEKAKRDATVLFNESQQSNESAFLSAAQVDRTVASILITVFRNSSMGYQRMYVDALRNIKHMLKKGYKAESLEYMKKQMMRDGLTEDQAERAANRIYNRSFARSATRLATFGFLVQFAWNLGPYMAYLLMGDDDDEKKDMIKDAAVRGLVGGPVEGLAAGQAISGVLGDFAMSEEISDPMLKLPATSDMESIFRQLEVDPVRAVNDIFNLVIQSGIGVNPQTLTDAVVAIIDGCNGDLETSKEAAFALMRILQTPQSQIEKLYMEEIDFTAEEALDMSVREFAERYAKYKVMRTAPLTKWMYSDEKEKELEDKYIKTFTKKASEMERTHGTEEAQEFFEYYDSEYEETAETLRDLKKQLEEAILDSDTEGEAKANEDIDNFLESEEFKKFEELLPHIKAYEAYRKALKTIDDPKTRSEYAEKMIQERNAAVEILRGEEISDL